MDKRPLRPPVLRYETPDPARPQPLPLVYRRIRYLGIAAILIHIALRVMAWVTTRH